MVELTLNAKCNIIKKNVLIGVYMPISFTDKFKIQKNLLKENNTFDPIIDLDTKFFIDPALIVLCKESEFLNAREKITDFFSSIILLIKHCKVKGDMYWKKAYKMLSFKEITGTCLGYSDESTDGNAIGPTLREAILLTIKELVGAGADAPELFELLGVFQERVGCDRTSDLITFILHENILQYTNRVVCNLGVKTTTITFEKRSYQVIVNPYNHKPLLLLPEIILSPLPIAKSFEDIDYVCTENQRVRDEINKYVDIDGSKKFTKSDIRTMMIVNKDFRDALVSAYKSAPREAFDFYKSQSGEYVWYLTAKEFVEKYPLELSKNVNTVDDIENITNSICAQFKKLVENNGLNKLLYDEKKPKHESAAQLLFLGIADTYCKANDIDLSPETNKGRGAIDFKLSHGYNKKVLVEVKLSSNSQLEHGFDIQLPIYMAQEETQRAIYLIVDNGHPKKIENFIKKYNELDLVTKNKIKYIIIDGTLKPSASVA
ncbi:MAG: hypothetical protein IJ800_05630 [Clostridia bacterium]|nr:hypothetical protein [Clostridia bacterium]